MNLVFDIRERTFQFGVRIDILKEVEELVKILTKIIKRTKENSSKK